MAPLKNKHTFLYKVPKRTMILKHIIIFLRTYATHKFSRFIAYNQARKKHLYKMSIYIPEDPDQIHFSFDYYSYVLFRRADTFPKKYLSFDEKSTSVILFFFFIAPVAQHFGV